MAKFDPSDHNVDEVLDELKDASPKEREEILAEEREGDARKTILEKFDAVEPAEGERVPYAWEVAPENQVRPVQPTV